MNRVSLILLLIVPLIFSQGCNGDGLHFKPAGPFPNKSTGFFYPDNFSDKGTNKGPEWGVDVLDLELRELCRIDLAYGNQARTSTDRAKYEPIYLHPDNPRYLPAGHYLTQWVNTLSGKEDDFALRIKSIRM